MAHPSDSHRFGTECPGSLARSELDLLLGACSPSDVRADELIEWIEDYEPTVRFVPDWSGESYKNAA